MEGGHLKFSPLSPTNCCNGESSRGGGGGGQGVIPLSLDPPMPVPPLPASPTSALLAQPSAAVCSSRAVTSSTARAQLLPPPPPILSYTLTPYPLAFVLASLLSLLPRHHPRTPFIICCISALGNSTATQTQHSSAGKKRQWLLAEQGPG